jgi:hypothetical protein
MMRRSGLRPAMSQPPKDVKRFSLLDFTPDGREVVYQNRAGLLVATHVSTGEQRSLFDCGKDPCFADVSPDGDRLAIGADAGLQVVDLATGDAVTLVAEGGSAPRGRPRGPPSSVPELLWRVDAPVGGVGTGWGSSALRQQPPSDPCLHE